MNNYVEPNELFGRYPAFTINSFTNVNSDILFYAAREVEGNLSRAFTVPFSDNHPTVKDLVIEAAWVRYNRMNEPKIGEKLNKQLKERFERIVNGEEQIITTSGDFLQRTFQDRDIPESTVEDYHPTHSMLGADHEYTRIDSSYIEDLENERHA